MVLPKRWISSSSCGSKARPTRNCIDFPDDRRQATPPRRLSTGRPLWSGTRRSDTPRGHRQGVPSGGPLETPIFARSSSPVGAVAPLRATRYAPRQAPRRRGLRLRRLFHAHTRHQASRYRSLWVPALCWDLRWAAVTSVPKPPCDIAGCDLFQCASNGIIERLPRQRVPAPEHVF